ncbi:MAG: outer membrane protein assembly factor BamB [Gammaproteobacteria bacterium]|nr:outer membrane protein assembly factor BamB [Gammaproteobacteria bacterium]
MKRTSAKSTARVMTLILPFSLVLFLQGCASNPIFTELFPSNGPRIETLWRVQVGEGVGKQYSKLAPVVTEKTIYAADTQGKVLAIDRKTGAVIWKKSFDLNIGGGLFAGYGLVLFGSSDGELLALDQTNGNEKWRIGLSGEILSPPQTNGSIVVAQTSDGSLYALDATSGKQKWVYQTIVPVLSLRGTSTPLIQANRVLAGFANGKFVSISLENGIPNWEATVALPDGRSELERIVDVDGRFVIDGDIAFVGAYQGKVVAVELSSGRVIWKRDISSHTGLESSLSNIYLTASSGELLALDQSNGVEIWRQEELIDRKPTVPVKMGPYLVVADNEGYLHWLSQVDGSMAIEHRVSGRTDRENPAAKNKALYQSINREPGNGIRTPVVVKEDELYLLSNHGVLHALALKK